MVTYGAANGDPSHPVQKVQKQSVANTGATLC